MFMHVSFSKIVELDTQEFVPVCSSLILMFSCCPLSCLFYCLKVILLLYFTFPSHTYKHLQGNVFSPLFFNDARSTFHKLELVDVLMIY